MRRIWIAGLLATAGMFACAGAGIATGEGVRELKWAELIPPPPVDAGPPKPKSLFPGAKPDDGAPPPPFTEGKFMSIKRRQPGSDVGPPRVVDNLDGQRVSIGGYVVPLDFDATSVKEFLLVPFVGACIHVPPPPANQIIYIKTDEGFDVSATFEPVTVTGTIKTAAAITGLADAGYTLEAESVVPRKE